MIAIKQRTDNYGPAQKMVSNMMVLAGEICANWCRDRNIPIPYRGIVRNPEPASSPELFKKEVIDVSVEKNGHASSRELMQYLRLLGRPAASTSPLQHFALGLPAYCKATSPLRRYVDLLTHWQVEAALRQEAKTGTSLIGNTDDSYLPFDRETMDEYAKVSLYQERKLRNAAASSRLHWIIQALFRAFYFKEAPLPETFKVTVLRIYKGVPQGLLNGWEIRVHLQWVGPAASQAEAIKAGDLWEARISTIEPYLKRVHMEPIRLIKQDVQLDQFGRI